ncbi:hypothetical protein [Silvibacterium acidisoli]|uniref:hypothetical protein n=1 Tax=Acidobacteriaceae bacterium ZG23-2 TaxID=2883246 RepID=UPI00406D2508
MRSSANSRTSTNVTMTEAETERLTIRGETFVVAWSSLLIALFALSYCFSHNLLLLYGDAVAHLHIARRLIDSINPGFRQLGSVWLPFPHIILLPFIWRMGWWQTGVAGAFPSMGAYVFATAGIYRLTRMWTKPAVAMLAALFLGLNPGLLYMQTTAMNEPLFLAQMIWAAVLIVEFRQALNAEEPERASKLIIGAGVVLVTAVFTRYDGWVYTFVAWLVAASNMLRRDRWKSKAGGAFVLFTVMLAVAPLVWMGYCARQFGDPLDFIRGPYSAKAIDARTSTPGAPHYPGWHSMRVAALYFLKASELGAVIPRMANPLFLLSIAGSVIAAIKWRAKAGLGFLLLWIPLPFYAYSVAYGSVPIFIPPWWPHSFYNTRYGMEMLPVFAISLAFLCGWIANLVMQRKAEAGAWVIGVFVLLIAGNSYWLYKQQPLVLQEAIANSRSRIPFEAAYANQLAILPKNVTMLVYTSEHIGAFQRAGIELKHTINESDYYQWIPALKDPAKAADYVITTDKDPVAKAVAEHPEGLTLINVVCSTGQPCVRFYRSDRHTAGGSITQK